MIATPTTQRIVFISIGDPSGIVSKKKKKERAASAPPPSSLLLRVLCEKKQEGGRAVPLAGKLA